jgi:hypothetical protein
LNRRIFLLTFREKRRANHEARIRPVALAWWRVNTRAATRSSRPR